MVQAIITLDDQNTRVLNVVKGKYGFKNKSEAMSYIITQYEQELLEPNLRPEYVEKLRTIDNGKFKKFANIAALRKELEHV